VKEAIDERERSKEESTVAISAVSVATYSAFAQKLQLAAVSKGPLRPPSEKVFVPFVWTTDENSGTDAAMRHLRDQLSANFDFNLENSNFDLVDIHSRHDFLNVQDEKIGKVSGGTDLIIVPSDIADISYQAGLCVLFELKTATAYPEKKNKFKVQSLLELVCARYLSNQPAVIVVLTDLFSEAIVYSINLVDGGYHFFEYTLSLAQMAEFVVEFIASQCRQSVIGLSDSRVEDLAAIGFKRKYQSMITSLAWERCIDEVGDTQPWSADRRQLIADVMMSCGVEEMPSILRFPSHMYS